MPVECKARGHVGKDCRESSECKGRPFLERLINIGTENSSTLQRAVNTCEGCLHFNELQTKAEIPQIVTIKRPTKRSTSVDDTLTLIK